MIRIMNRIPISTPAVVKPYSIAFRMVLFMYNNLRALFQAKKGEYYRYLKKVSLFPVLRLLNLPQNKIYYHL